MKFRPNVLFCLGIAWVLPSLLAAAPARAAGAGDVAVIWFASDDPDGLAFVVLREIPAGTVLRFTDSGWTTGGSFRPNEGGVQYTAAAALPAGTVVSATNPYSGAWATNNSGLGSGGYLLSTDGDQILTFVGDASAPQFLHAVCFDSSGFSNATTSNTTALPTGLVVGTTALSLGETDNAYYNGPTSGTPDELLAAIATASNWVTNNTRITPPSWNFVITGGLPHVAVVTVDADGPEVGDFATVTVELAAAPAAGQPATVQLTSGAFAAPVAVVIDNPNLEGSAEVELVNEGIWTVTASAVSGALGSAESGSFAVGSPVFPPTAYAGSDRNVQLVGSVVVVQLFDATAGDLNGLAGLAYAWTPATDSGLVGWQNRTGAVVEENDPGSAAVTFDTLGVYTLTLTVTDPGNLTATDTVVIRVVEPTPVEEDEYAPPAGYYDAATGVGSGLKTQLAQIITTGHTQQSYGTFKNSSARYDADPNVPGNILLAYNRASVSGAWDAGSTWNREHVWPQSLQPGDASDSTKGNLGDPYVLRPCNPSINSSRGNKPFGNFDTLGSYSSQGAFYFPGDPDKGDFARSLMYSATRYMDTLALVNGAPSGNTMGDLASLIRWNYTDTPDTFERRRGHLIYQDQGNRNPYIDHPEFVWSVFGDGANDSTLYVSANRPADGVSALPIELPGVIVGGPLPAPVAVTLRKAGTDPTYYSVTASGDAVSDVNGRYNAFDYNAQERTLTITMASSTVAAGLKTGSVVVNNLDITSQGAGQGVDDGNDVIDLSLAVYDHAEASLAAGVNQDATTIAFSPVAEDAGVQSIVFSIYNLAAPSGLTANLDIVGVDSYGDDGMMTIDVTPSAGLPADTGFTFHASLDPAGTTPGTYTATWLIAVADENLPGGTAGETLVITLKATVTDTAVVHDIDGDGDVDLVDWASFVECLTGPGGGLALGACAVHDADADADVDLEDAAGFQAAFTGALP